MKPETRYSFWIAWGGAWRPSEFDIQTLAVRGDATLVKRRAIGRSVVRGDRVPLISKPEFQAPLEWMGSTDGGLTWGLRHETRLKFVGGDCAVEIDEGHVWPVLRDSQGRLGLAHSGEDGRTRSESTTELDLVLKPDRFLVRSVHDGPSPTFFLPTREP